MGGETLMQVTAQRESTRDLQGSETLLDKMIMVNPYHYAFVQTLRTLEHKE